MKIKRIELMNALESVKYGLDSKSTIEQSDCFIFINNQIATYNDSIAVSFPFEVNVEGAVRSQELISLIHKVKDDVLDISYDKGQLKINGNKFKSGIVMEKEIALPLDFLKAQMEFKKIPMGLVEAVKTCAFSIANENHYPHLSNIHVKDNIVESCDNFRATRVELQKGITNEFLMPSAAIRGLVQYNFDHYALTEGWISLTKENGAVFSCRIYEDKYPDISQFFESSGRSIRLPSELSEILDRGSVFKSESHSQEVVTIIIDSDNITVRGENEYGWFEESIELKRKGGEELSFKASYKTLQDILKHSNRALVSETVMKFKAKGFEHVVCLIKGEKV